jgi:peptidoglycan/LPS O-acetylase OafA/YrhL
MDYRREIDGLRALAVLPVILFHAGFETFSGGFVGVDVFFVISGYLITSIILAELEQGNFSIIKFYERRARRILPALFVIMFFSLILGYFLLMPDEFKNLGQSFVATSLFSNNVLLGLTSGYWDLASEFKPLLHTWSLGVEEQYYVIVPVLLLVFWKIGKSSIVYLLWSIFLTSLLFAVWFVNISPKWSFYLLPTRAWEICIGALAAIYSIKYSESIEKFKYSGALSLLGLVLIIFSILVFDSTVLSPGLLLLIPTVGAVLLIIFCRHNSIAFSLLANRVTVFLGLLSYSLYLWHQPIFAFLRAYSDQHPSSFSFLALIPLVFLLSYITWKFVETPFRNKSIIGRNLVFFYSFLGTVVFVTIGLYLNKSYGMASRVFYDGVVVADMDKRIYNERAFAYKKEGFADKSITNLLIIGNSFGRDFTNITVENFDNNRVEIVYRDDLGQCIETKSSSKTRSLFNDADVIVYASGGYDKDCFSSDIYFANSRGKKIFYVGTKDFGYNLNWLIRLSKEQRKNQFNPIAESILVSDKEMSEAIPSEHFISLLGPTVVGGKIPVTDDMGRMLSTDRAHLTKYGALYFGKKAVAHTRYAEIFQ